MLIMLLKNVQKGTDETVSLLQLLAMGEQTVQIGEVPSKAMHYVFKPQIGFGRAGCPISSCIRFPHS